jgi:hypothetical protein
MSRVEWLRLPFRWILHPVLDAPELVFPWHLEAHALIWRREIQTLRGVYLAARRARDVKRLRGIAHRVRVLHSRLVASAEGYRYPGERLIIEFPPDAQ